MNRFPLTIPQQGLWSGHLLNDDKAMFNTAECIAFDGKVEAAVLAAALAKAVGECEALKGHFEDDKEAVCFVSHELPLAYEEISLEHDDETLARAWAWADLRRRHVPDELALNANLIFLVDRADAVRARGVADALRAVDVQPINIAGCPPNPINFVGTVVHLLTQGEPPELDSHRRPKMFFGRTVHDKCERRKYFDKGQFALSFASEEARQGSRSPVLLHPSEVTLAA